MEGGKGGEREGKEDRGEKGRERERGDGRGGERRGEEGRRKEDRGEKGIGGRVKKKYHMLLQVTTQGVFTASYIPSCQEVLYLLNLRLYQGYTQSSYTHAPMLNGYKLPGLLVQKEITTDEEL